MPVAYGFLPLAIPAFPHIVSAAVIDFDLRAITTQEDWSTGESDAVAKVHTI